MKAFVWHDVERLTTRYHDSGGLLIIGEDLTDARVMLRGYAEDKKNEMDEDVNPDALTKEPDLILPLEDSYREPGIYIFPDAGCC